MLFQQQHSCVALFQNLGRSCYVAFTSMHSQRNIFMNVNVHASATSRQASWQAENGQNRHMDARTDTHTSKGALKNMLVASSKPGDIRGGAPHVKANQLQLLGIIAMPLGGESITHIAPSRARQNCPMP